jgi:hypothetical protein
MFVVISVAVIMIGLSLPVLFRIVRCRIIGCFPFKDWIQELEIMSNGFYSISVLGAGSIRQTNEIKFTITRDDESVACEQTRPRYTFVKNNVIAVAGWGFAITSAGRYTIKATNLERLEGKTSTLMSKRTLQAPLEHSGLGILIHEGAKPVYVIAAIVSLTVGVTLLIGSIVL